MEQEYKASGVQLIKLENENDQFFSDECININEHCEAILECIKEEVCDKESDTHKTGKDPLALHDDESERKDDNNMVNTIYIKGEPVFPQNTQIENEILENENEYDYGDLEDIKHDIDVQWNIVDCPVINSDVTSASVYEDGNRYPRIHNDGGNTTSISGDRRFLICPENNEVLQESIQASKRKRKRFRNLECHTCKKTFTVSGHLFGKIHEQIKYKCEECKRSVKTSKGYSEIVDNVIKSYECQKCNKKFSSSKSLKYHIRSIHEGITYKCEECSRGFTHFESIKKHIKIEHSRIERYECHKCMKKFSKFKNLKIHVRTVHKGIKYKCDKCYKSFTRRYELRVHINNVHMKTITYECHKCKKAFSTSSNLKTHINSIHEGMKYKCKECYKCFTRSWSLKTHYNSIHKKMSYVCHICAKSFAAANNLRTHIRNIHEGFRYKCKECEKSFQGSWNLKKHINSVHGK